MLDVFCWQDFSQEEVKYILRKSYDESKLPDTGERFHFYGVCPICGRLDYQGNSNKEKYLETRYHSYFSFPHGKDVIIENEFVFCYHSIEDYEVVKYICDNCTDVHRRTPETFNWVQYVVRYELFKTKNKVEDV